MIVHWFKLLLRFFFSLFVMPPRVDPNATCWVCGARSGHLRCVQKTVGQGDKVATLCQHTCNVCGARSFRKPIATVNPAMIQPAIPRNDIEAREDTQATMAWKAP